MCQVPRRNSSAALAKQSDSRLRVPIPPPSLRLCRKCTLAAHVRDDSASALAALPTTIARSRDLGQQRRIKRSSARAGRRLTATFACMGVALPPKICVLRSRSVCFSIACAWLSSPTHKRVLAARAGPALAPPSGRRRRRLRHDLDSPQRPRLSKRELEPLPRELVAPLPRQGGTISASWRMEIQSSRSPPLVGGDTLCSAFSAPRRRSPPEQVAIPAIRNSYSNKRLRLCTSYGAPRRASGRAADPWRNAVKAFADLTEQRSWRSPPSKEGRAQLTPTTRRAKRLPASSSFTTGGGRRNEHRRWLNRDAPRHSATHSTSPWSAAMTSGVFASTSPGDRAGRWRSIGAQQGRDHHGVRGPPLSTTRTCPHLRPGVRRCSVTSQRPELAHHVGRGSAPSI